MTNTGTIFVATDLSESADEALRQGDARATAAAAELVVCTVVPPLSRANVLFPHGRSDDDAARVRLREEALAALISRTCQITGRDPAQFRAIVDEGAADERIVSWAERERAALVVIGNRGASGLARMLLGSVAERVVRYAHSPVLVARVHPKSGRLLVATDLTDPAVPALAAAAREAAPEAVALHCVEVSPAVAAGEYGMVAYAADSPDAIREIRERAADRLAGACRIAGFEGRRRVESGGVSYTILSVAEEIEADLLVIGTRGRTGLRRVLLGSVAEFVVRHAACSVLVVRLDERP